MTALVHLLRLLRGRWFRRLLAVRLSSQLADGVFQVALASYVLFSPERQPTARAIAFALAIVLLPFSLLGPFAGVFLDRWPRRQVLLWANLARMVTSGGLALLVTTPVPDGWLVAVVLLSLSMNRFLLAGLSASLPHTVAVDDLLTANSLTPTAGTLAALTGVGIGVGARGALGGDVGVLLLAGVLYGAAGGLALRMPRHLLGPDGVPATRLGAAFGEVGAGLVAGLRHLRERRAAAYALMTVTAQRFCYGVSTVAVILLYRSYFHRPSEADAAFHDLAVVVLVSGAGFLTAAILTPVAVERLPRRTWMVALLVAGAIVQIFPGALFTQPALLVVAFVLGVVAQGLKICVDTVVQLSVDDAFRGRVFSVYDVLFNVAFVAAAATAALVVPADGRSVGVLIALAVGYLATAAGYAGLTRA